MGHAGTVCTGLCPIRMDLIVTQITTVAFGNIATVTSHQITSHHNSHITTSQDVALTDHADIVYSVCNIFHLIMQCKQR